MTNVGYVAKLNKQRTKKRTGAAMERWQVRKDGNPVAGGPIATRPDDQTARQMSKAGYILYINGKRYRPGKGGSP